MRRRLSVIAGAVALGASMFSIGSLTAGGGSQVQSKPQTQVAAETLDATGDSVDACTLITEAEAADSLGTAVTTVPNPSQCTYIATDGSARALSVSVPDYFGPPDGFESGVEQVAHAFEGSYQPVSAGDEGYAIVSPLVSEGLARSSDTYVVVVLTNAQGTDSEQAGRLDSLLQLAISRL